MQQYKQVIDWFVNFNFDTMQLLYIYFIKSSESVKD